MVHFGVQPSEVWQMTPHDYWDLHAFKFDQPGSTAQGKPMTRSEYNTLKERIEAKQAAKARERGNTD